MKNFILGFVIGTVLATVATVYAASQSATWRTGAGVEVGTASNPVYVIGV